jgi:hypothetical protein
LVVPPAAGYWLAGEPLLPFIGPLFIWLLLFCTEPPALPPELFIDDDGLPALSLLPGPPAPPVVCAIDGAAPDNDRAKPSETTPRIFFIWNPLFEENLLALTIARLKEFLPRSRGRVDALKDVFEGARTRLLKNGTARLKKWNRQIVFCRLSFFELSGFGCIVA